MAWRDYFWPGTEVLRNKLDIHDADALDAVEHRLTQARQVQIEQGEAAAAVRETFDAQHIRALHR